jgi:hypothetical protein
LREPHTVPHLDPLALHDGEQILVRARASVNEKFLRGLAHGWLYLTTERLAWHRGTDLLGSTSAASPYGLEWAFDDISVENTKRKMWSDLLVTCTCHERPYRLHLRSGGFLPARGTLVAGKDWLAAASEAVRERG